MNIPIPAPTPGLQDLFFRAADRMRVEGCANAVVNEGLSLALSCAHEALLDHYVQQLLQRLRTSAPDMGIEVYFPANTESLISRFNELLASQSVRDATRASGDQSGTQIWLVHDAQTLPPHELQLLARLIQNFPGANIRAILLMIGPAPTQESLSAFGRKLLRWEIEAPTEEQAQAALELATLQGQEDSMRLLLRRMGKLRRPYAWPDEELQAPSLSPERQAMPAPIAPAAPAPTGALARARAQIALWRARLDDFRQRLAATPEAVAGEELPKLQWSERLTQWRQHKPLWIAAAGALGLSVLLMMWIQPASFGLKSKDRTALAKAGEASAAQALAAQTPVVSVSAGPKPVAVPELPEPAIESQAWLRAIPPQHFLIQHSTAATYEKAQQQTKFYASLREAQIVPAYRPGEKLAYFVVVSGPYENAGKAYERMARKDLPNTSWVRTAQSLQQQLEPTAKETR